MRHVMAVAALVLALAGCGGTADPLPEGATDFPSTQPAATEPTTTAAENRRPRRRTGPRARRRSSRWSRRGAGRRRPRARRPGARARRHLPARARASGRGPGRHLGEALAELEERGLGGAGPAAVASTCDVAREAFLTGSEAEIEAALAALVADTTADAAAREAAQSYLEDGRPDAAGPAQGPRPVHLLDPVTNPRRLRPPTWLALAVLLGLALAGCGGGGTEPEEPAGPAETGSSASATPETSSRSPTRRRRRRWRASAAELDRGARGVGPGVLAVGAHPCRRRGRMIGAAAH